MKFESLKTNSNDKKEKITLKEKFSKLLRSKVLIGALSIASITAFESCTGHNDYSEFQTFNEAFKKARENDEKVFKWHDKKYTTDLVDKETSNLYWESKKFLEEYYSSDYFKSKHPVDSLDIKMSLYGNMSNNPRYQYLEKKIENESFTLEEGNEFYNLLLEEEAKTSYDSPQFKHKADSIQSIPGKQRIENLKKPIYISITNKKGEMSEEGHYARHKNTDKRFMYIYRTKGSKDITTPIHELTHKSSDANAFIGNSQFVEMYENAYNSAKDNKDFVMKYGQEGFDYLSNPTEIDARQNSTRFWLFKNFKGYKPDTVFNGEHYDFLSENYAVLPGDIQQLLELFPRKKIFISNMNTY